jgi:DNA-binding transcriptional regulator YiaG
MSNLSKLIKIQKKYKLSKREIAKMLGVSYRCVDYWLSNERKLRDQMINLLEFKLKLKEK